MKRIMIVPSKCNNCNPCEIEIICPKNAVFREAVSEKPWIDFYKCSGCLKCKPACIYSALEEISRPCSEKNKGGW